MAVKARPEKSLRKKHEEGSLQCAEDRVDHEHG